MSRRSRNADRSTGGPGSSRQNTVKAERNPNRRPADAPEPGEPTNQSRSRVSGGGGERDYHHAHGTHAKGRHHDEDC